MVTTNDVAYEADGCSLLGYLAVPEGTEERPGVLICHEGPGLDDHGRDSARRLAELGYVAFALDYHGGGKPIADQDAMMARLGELMGDAERTRALGEAGLEQLRSHPRTDGSRLAAIGYCFGGTMALELARSGADLKAAVGFHSGLATTKPAQAGKVGAVVLAMIGADDPIIPPEQRADFEREMTAAGADWRLYVFGGAVHSFTNPARQDDTMPGIKYHRPTAERSWRAMLDLFDEVF